MRRLALALLVLVSSPWLAAGPAHAYVRYKAKDGVTGLYWPATCVPVTAYLDAFDQMRANDVAKAVAAAAHTWSPDEVTCADGTSHPYLEIVPSLSSDGGMPPLTNDSRNVLVIRTASWPHEGMGLAITTVSSGPDGHIVDADIEVNAHDYQWANLDPGVQLGGNHADLYDLQNALTHEFGHFIGLDHSCYSGPGPAPTDNLGNPAPDCDASPPAVRATVMYTGINPFEVSKRVLSPDDVQAVCDIYPAALEPRSCPLDVANDSVGCSVAPADADVLALGLGALALGWVGRRRRRSR
jgi:MYXO-CTERM domain-containing protein